MKRGNSTPNTILISIDIGTTKISVLVARHLGQGCLEIIGLGNAPSQGIARDVIVDIAPAVSSIKTAVKEAELMSGIPIESAYIGISGSHIQARTSQGVVALKHGEIRARDITHVITAAQAIPINEGQQVLHVLPQFYTIDGEHQVRDPLGMYGVRLEAQVHIIMAGLTSTQNLVRCCEMAGIKIRDIILEPVASADAILSTDEKELGVVLLDIGGGTSDLVFYQHGTIRHTKIIPIAGDLFTHDVALCLRTTLKEAERIKKEFGCAHSNSLQPQEKIAIEMIHGGNSRVIDRQQLISIIESRAKELFEIVSHEILTHNLQVSAGVVLTGGGALLAGIEQVAQDEIGLPVRIGVPHVDFNYRELLGKPTYATAYGLLLHALQKHKFHAVDSTDPLATRLFTRMRSWVLDFL